MCGIVGVFPYGKLNKKLEKVRTEAMLWLFTEVLQKTHKRGEDATGVAALFQDGDYFIQKMATPSPKFISRIGGTPEHFDGFLSLCRDNLMDNNVRLAGIIGHCRKSSVGSKSNVNNHPIKTGEIIGMHNGTLTNHNIIFDKLKCGRDGVVDSEAIFRLIQHYTKNGKNPFTIDMLEEVGVRLDGPATYMAMNTNNPYQIAFMKEKRPLVFVYIRPLQLLIAVSDENFVNSSLYDFNKTSVLYNSGFPTLKEGDVKSVICPENNVGIIDLTVAVDDNTIPNDLIEKKDIWKSDKKWRSVKTSTYTNGNSSVGYDWRTQQQNFPAANRKKQNTSQATANVATNTTANTTAKDNDIKFEGSVFCKELGKYVAPDEVKEAAKVGAVMINSGTGTVKAIDSSTKLDKKDEAKTVTNKERLADTDSKVEKKTVEVGHKPEVVEAAKDADITREQYRDNKDLMDDLSVVDEDTLGALEPYVLGNKIRKRVCQSAFRAGAEYARKIKVNANKDPKDKSASVIVRLAKKVIFTFAGMCDGFYLNNEDLEEAIVETAADYEEGEFTEENIKKLFNEGDRSSNPVIDIFVSLFEKKESVNESNGSNTKVRENGHK